MEKIIQIQHLCKSFSNIKAVNDISFEVRKGELFAFLGVNGAGKSTTINILVGILEKDSGEIEIDGYNLNQIDKILPNIGIVFQSSILDSKLTVYDNLKYRALLYDLTKEEFEVNLKYLADKLEFSNLLKRSINQLSGGQKRKIDIARGLIHSPKILILDEPTTGLDPQTRKLVWSLVEEKIQKEKLTVILTTHYMEEANIANYVVIIDKGHIVAKGTPIELKNHYAYDYLKIYDYKKELIEILNREKMTYEIKSNYIEIRFKDTYLAKQFIVKNERYISDLEIIKGSMDDVFLNVTGKQLEKL